MITICVGCLPATKSHTLTVRLPLFLENAGELAIDFVLGLEMEAASLKRHLQQVGTTGAEEEQRRSRGGDEAGGKRENHASLTGFPQRNKRDDGHKTENLQT